MYIPKLITPLLLLAGLQFTALAQSSATPAFGKAVIRGHIANHSEPSFSAWKNKLIGGTELTIPVDQNGNFSTQIEVEGETMDVMLHRPDRRILLHDKDTLTLTWDAKNAKQTFTATNLRNDQHTRQLRMLAKLEDTWSKPYDSLKNSLRSTEVSATDKYAAINNLYNREMQTLVDDTVFTGADKLAIDTYFKYTGLLQTHRLLPEFKLAFKNAIMKEDRVSVLTPETHYRVESEVWFNNNVTYRDFLYDYIRLSELMSGVTFVGYAEDLKNKVLSVTVDNPRHRYNLGMNALRLIKTRDWYATRIIMDDFYPSRFKQTTDLYNEVIGTIKTPYYADTLKQFYQNIQHLKPGMAHLPVSQ